jgi:cytochrome c2
VLGIVAGLFLWFRRGAKFGPVLGLIGVAMFVVGLVFLPANQVETAVAQPSAIESSAEMGAILFQTKGCVTCHQHADVSYEGMQVNIGPNLTRPKVTPEFLRMWLSDPAQVRPETKMPNLELADEEIEALIAFLVED